MEADAVTPRGDFTPSLTPISREAPWEWVGGGWQDLWKAPAFSLGYGLVFLALGGGIFFGLQAAGLSSMIAVFAGGFLLLGPMLAVGLYELSRRHETSAPFRLGEIAFVRTASPVQLAYLGFALLFAFLVWARVAQLLFALFMGGSVSVATGSYPSVLDFIDYATGSPEGWALLATGTAFGAVIAFAVFAMTAISVPMLMERRTDVFTAVATSIKAVVHYPGPMIVWAWIIAVVIATSLLTLGLGLVIAFPLIGHASWRAYRALVPPA